jgi:hypothetical protein
VVYSFVRRVGRGASLAALVMLILALSGGEALAAHQVGHVGTTGRYSFTDTVSMPGARCVYAGAAGTWEFDHATVRPPLVFWPLNSSSNSGTVGWRLKLQHLTNGVWSNVLHTGVTKATARKHVSAMFARKTITWMPPAPNSGLFRVEVALIWFRTNGTVMGRTLVVIDHNRHKDLANVTISPVSRVCRATFPIAP